MRYCVWGSEEREKKLYKSLIVDTKMPRYQDDSL